MKKKLITALKWLKVVAALLTALVLLAGGLVFFSAWSIAKEMSQPVEWRAVESIDENGNVTFSDEPGIVEQKDYTVWDVLGAYYRHIRNSGSIGELFGPVLLDTGIVSY